MIVTDDTIEMVRRSIPQEVLRRKILSIENPTISWMVGRYLLKSEFYRWEVIETSDRIMKSRSLISIMMF